MNCCTCTGVVGILPYYIPELPGAFCSSECTDIAYEHFLAQIRKTKTGTRKAKVNVHQKAEDFGGAEVYRHFCDNPECKKPIVLCWKSREGEFCSNKCMKETQASLTTTETNTVAKPTTIEENMSEKKENKSSKKAVVGKPAAAKITKPKVEAKKAKAAVAKLKAPKANGKPRPVLDDKAVIHIVSKDHKYKGINADRFKLLSDGMTVDNFVTANKNKLDNKRCGYAYIADFLASATKSGLITVGTK